MYSIVALIIYLYFYIERMSFMENNEQQKDIVNFCSVSRSSKEILERVGVTYHSKNIQTYIMSLIEAGYLEMTNPEHPNASNQKYRRSKK